MGDEREIARLSEEGKFLELIPPGHVYPEDGGDESARIERLVSSVPVFVFLHGNPGGAMDHEPSSQLVEIFKEYGVKFSAYDVDRDARMKQRVGEISKMNDSFPQVFVKAEFFGGLERIQELAKDKKLMEHIPEDSRGMTLEEAIHQHCDSLVKSDHVVVFMKGTVDYPKCGFSNKMLTLLMSRGVKYSTINILDDQNVRDGMKKYSNWPTFPQLYVEGKFVGGLDVCKELDESGELVEKIPDVALVRPKKKTVE